MRTVWGCWAQAIDPTAMTVAKTSTRGSKDEILGIALLPGFVQPRGNTATRALFQDDTTVR
jgi:hypothetical protein